MLHQDASHHAADRGNARVVAVSTSPGGIPKLPRKAARATVRGLEGDGHHHDKHNRPDRAISLLDLELLRQLVCEGFPLQPGASGENLTVSGLQLQSLTPGTLLCIGEVLLRLEEPRKPCYVLDTIDPRLKVHMVNRCGYLASVVREGEIRPGMPIEIVDPPQTPGTLGGGATP